MMAELRNIPQSALAAIVGALGSTIKGAQGWARERSSFGDAPLANLLKAAGVENPVDLLGDPGGALEDWSYGFGPVRTSEGTQGVLGRLAGLKVDPRVLDVAGLVPAYASTGRVRQAVGQALTKIGANDAALEGTVLAASNLAPVSGAVGKRAAKNVKKGATGQIDWESMTPEGRQAFALRGGHLKQMPDGKYVGSPGFTSPAQLGAARAKLHDEVKEVLEKPWATDYAPWYERQRAGHVEAAGPDPRKQHNLARGTGVYSPQATPDVNFSAAGNQMAHHAYTGDPTSVERTGAQSRNFAKQLTGGEARLGKKTGPFANSSDPTVADPHMATNDIWVGRLFGYDNGEFSRGFTAAEHGFVQGELQRVTAIANREGWGGKKTWTVEEIQALPWVHKKAQSLAAKRKDMTYEEGVAEAMRTTLEALPRNTAYMNNEVIPGAASRHLEGVRTGSPELKAAYTEELGNFRGPDSRSVFTQSLPNALERPSLPFVGDYVNSQGVRETNPGIAFRPIIERQGGKAGPGVRDTSQHAMNVQQGLHGLFNMQEGSPWSAVFPNGPGIKVRDLNAAIVGDAGAPVSADTIAGLRETLTSRGLPHQVDLGDGRVMVTNFDDPVDLSAKSRRAVAKALDKVNVVFGKRESGGAWLTDALSQPEGSGAATREILSLLDKNPEQSRYLLQQFDKNPAVFEHIAGGGARDAKYAEITGTPARADLQRLRDKAGEMKSLEALFDWLRRNGSSGFPAVGAAPLAWDHPRGE